jgi:hypothetical protein
MGSWEAASYLRNTDEEIKVHTVVSRWFNVCCTGLDNFGEKLTLDDVVAEDKATQTGAGAGSSCATHELGSSSRRRRRR